MAEVKASRLIIRGMREAELKFAAECTTAEGWLGENFYTLEGFFQFDPPGCLIAEQDGHPVGICIATFYGTSGFIGELIVRPEARGRGVGAALLNHGITYLKGRGVATVYLDGVGKAVGLYERNGFHKVCRSWRFHGQPAGKASPQARRMVASDLEQVSALDYRSFRADRSFFLRRRFAKYPELCYLLVEAGHIVGYIMGRRDEDWIAAGPWVMNEQTGDPSELLNAFAFGVAGQAFSLGILDTNRAACDLVHSLGFVEREDSPWRMALGTSHDLGASPQCYAVGSAAKG
jgi:ribosomal protein S18 acetylase RimI-like enzyme